MKSIRVTLALLLLSVIAFAGQSANGSLWAQSCMAPPAGLVSWWPGDGHAEDLVGQNEGTLENGAMFAPGMVGQAFSFDGVDDIVIATATGFPTGTAPRTVAFWAKTDLSASEATGFGYGGEATGRGFYIFTADDDNGGRLSFSGHGSAFDLFSSNAPDLRDNQYHHVAATYDGTTVTLYADGVPVAAGSFSLNTGISGGACIGGRCPLHEFLTGDVDEVAVWSRALSTSEIQAIFDAGGAGMCKPNGHYYELVQVDAPGVNWYEARDAAAAMVYNGMPGHLATITDAQEENLLVSSFPEIYPEYVWLGASDEASEGDWQWITGEAWSYTDWADGEPNGGTFENCLDFGDHSAQWNDESCERSLNFYLVEYSLA